MDTDNIATDDIFLYHKKRKSILIRTGLLSICLLTCLVLLHSIIWELNTLTSFIAWYSVMKIVGLVFAGILGLAVAQIASHDYKFNPSRSMKITHRWHKAWFRFFDYLAATYGAVILFWIATNSWITIFTESSVIEHLFYIVFLMKITLCTIISFLVSLFMQKTRKEVSKSSESSALGEKLPNRLLACCFLMGSIPGAIICLILMLPLSEKTCSLIGSKYC